MAFTGAEPILDALATALRTYLPARLDALEAIPLSPALTLADVSEVTIGDRDVAEGFPFVALSYRPSQIDHENLGKMNIAHQVELRLWLNDETPESLERRTLRYLRAIFEVLRDRDAAGDFTFTLSLNAQQITPSEQRRNEKGAMERDVALSMLCWATEER